MSYLGSKSQTVELTVLGYAFAQPLAFRATTPHRPGEMVGAAVEVRNTGESPGEIHVDVWDNDTGELLWRSPRRILAVNETYTFSDADIGPMPTRNWGLVAQTHHDGEIDGMLSFVVELTVDVATSLTLELNKATVTPGEEYDWAGHLLRRDTGEGIGDQWISCRRNGVEVARVPTDANGFYWARITAPSVPGVYQNNTVFEEVTISGTTFLSSLSKTIRLGVGLPPIPKLAWWQWGLIGLAALSGVGGAIYILRKR